MKKTAMAAESESTHEPRGFADCVTPTRDIRPALARYVMATERQNLIWIIAPQAIRTRVNGCVEIIGT